MSSASGKSPGWAAFDLKQRQKQGLEPELDKEPYPPIPSSFTSLRPCRNSASNGCSGRSFSSLLTKVAEVSNLVIAFNKLKELYSWADNSLIEDIMAAVDNDIDKASTLLGAMVSTGSFEENKETSIVELNSTSGNPYENCKLQADNGVFLGNGTVLSELSSTIGDLLIDNNKGLTDECGSSGKNLFDDAADMTLILGRMKSIPIEPEWEEDDVYLSHRKDAIRFMRHAQYKWDIFTVHLLVASSLFVIIHPSDSLAKANPGGCSRIGFSAQEVEIHLWHPECAFLFPTIKVERLLYSELFSIRVINFADKDIEISDTGRPAEEGNWIREEIDIIFLKTFSQ
ncbi:hypothetical protein CK203_002319 [Vitis vinifera]|uniref:Uncharacterized protein n=1 Tax=Vitis vinifera TaxID=29760 RepID=A0A438KJ14_VITVI|nr:hypothetical protein CK203_002319 [Vitis vinifera]